MIKVYLLRLFLRLFYFFPINKKKVFFSSYEGGSASCNPKYIYIALRKKHGDELRYVWEINDRQRSFLVNERIRAVKHNSLGYIYQIMTSGTIITNTEISPVFPLRKNQLGINTWHGAGCYKRAGIDYHETNNVEYIKRREYSEKNIKYYLSGCQAWTDVFSKAVVSDPHKFLGIGSPRIDYLLNGLDDKSYSAIKDSIGVEKKIVLYAPTYRGGRGLPEESRCPLNVESLLRKLSDRFGGQWVFAYRCHYATASTFKDLEDSVDLSGYEDMQELLAVADILISDYSSSIWDYSFTGKPCFLYCYDLADYEAERDFYIPIEKWHFPVSRNETELHECISSFTEASFIEGMRLHHSELGSFENGMATDEVIKIIEKQFGV